MKFRKGFVSNSSSSSFLVVFDKIPESQEELKTLLFGSREVLAVYDDGITTERAAAVIWQDIQEQLGDLPYDREKISSELSAQASDMIYKELGMAAYWGPDGESGEDTRARWKKMSDRTEQITEQITDEFLAKHEGKNILIFEYSDNDGSFYSTLEHGNTFDALPHERISKH